MNKYDREKIVNLYEGRYKKLGYDIRTVGWRDWPQQNLRFEVLTAPFDLEGKEICDVGCGFGDFFGYLKKSFGDIKYTGIDIVPSLIGEAKRSYPRGKFLLIDMLDDKFTKKFDYCFLSGALNLRISNNILFAKRMIKKMFDISKEAIAFNMLSTYVDYRKKINFHYDPKEFFNYAKSLTRFVTLRHDYPLWEFTIYMLKGSYVKIKRY